MKHQFQALGLSQHLLHSPHCDPGLGHHLAHPCLPATTPGTWVAATWSCRRDCFRALQLAGCYPRLLGLQAELQVRLGAAYHCVAAESEVLLWKLEGSSSAGASQGQPLACSSQLHRAWSQVPEASLPP